MKAHRIPPLRARPNRTVDQVQRQYLEWAYAKGLKHVHAWRGTLGYSSTLKSVDLGRGLKCTFLDPDTFNQVGRPADEPQRMAA